MKRTATLRLMLLALVGAGCGSDDEKSAQGASEPTDNGASLSTQQVSPLHEAFTDLLQRYVRVSTDGMQTFVDYNALNQDPADRQRLKDYLARLSATDPSGFSTHEEALAFWLNSYNAVVIQGVLDNFGGRSDYSVSDSLFRFFRSVGHDFFGYQLNLDQIEHGVIRGRMSHPNVIFASAATREQIRAWHALLYNGGPVDARIHIGLNCASLGCPNLVPAAFESASVNTMLDTAARAFVSDPSKGAGEAGISRLFDWFGGDFDAYAGSPEAFVRTYRDDLGAEQINFKAYLDYDWTLNIVP